LSLDNVGCQVKKKISYVEKLPVLFTQTKENMMQKKQSACKVLFTVLTITLLLSFLPVCHAADNLTNFNTICDWIEVNLPDYFSPMAETFETSGFFIRYYENTETYVGTINGEFYVLGGAFGNEVVDVGTNEYLLSLINPQQSAPIVLHGTYNYQNQNYTMSDGCRQGLRILGLSESSLIPASGIMRINEQTDHSISIDVKGSGSLLGISGEWVPLNGTVSNHNFTATYSGSLSESGESVEINVTLTGVFESADSFSGSQSMSIIYNGYGYNINCQLDANYQATQQ